MAQPPRESLFLFLSRCSIPLPTLNILHLVFFFFFPSSSESRLPKKTKPRPKNCGVSNMRRKSSSGTRSVSYDSLLLRPLAAPPCSPNCSTFGPSHLPNIILLLNPLNSHTLSSTTCHPLFCFYPSYPLASLQKENKAKSTQRVLWVCELVFFFFFTRASKPCSWRTCSWKGKRGGICSHSHCVK
jgi:hypothetical protein